MRRPRPSGSWAPLRAAERAAVALPRHGRHRLALAYANRYHVGMSSLGFQRVYELVHRTPDWVAERFFLDHEGMPRSVEHETPLGEFGAVAFSVSFEQDYVGLLQLLARAGIPLWRTARGPGDPLVILGGACAAINPLPMAPFVDLFALGAAENLLPALQAALAEEGEREEVLARLAATPGFFVPAHHDPEALAAGEKLRKLELTAAQMRAPGHLPTSCLVTPHTEFAEKFLIEMSRGCPEKCRYCWASFGMGKFRAHPTEFLLAAIARAREVTDQLGFVATAVGDHPEIERLLATAVGLGMRAAVSSIRIPAVTEGVLAALHASGARSLTLAPETGTDRLRRLLNKPVPNELLLEKVRLIFRHGFREVKLYFIVGLPGETMADVEGIVALAAACREVMLAETRPTGRAGTLLLGVNVFVPKPYTPWQREPVASEASLTERIALLRRELPRLGNVRMSGSLSIRQAVWQTLLSRGGPEVAGAIAAVAGGESVARVLRAHAPLVAAEVFAPRQGDQRWHFLRLG
jgi:radical SAM superfamily enzyme YgiQ (UPF0313 family)